MPALPCIELAASDQQLLRDLVCHIIQHGLGTGGLQCPDWDMPESLQQNAATFVTIRVNQQLLGCIGSTVASRPLWRDVAERAHAAAFSGHYNQVLQAAQLPATTFSISILSEFKQLAFTSEADLLRQLIPGEMGLLLKRNNSGALFLPAVWEHFANRGEFVKALKQKAGWPSDYWHPQIEASYFYTVCIEGDFVASK